MPPAEASPLPLFIGLYLSVVNPVVELGPSWIRIIVVAFDCLPGGAYICRCSTAVPAAAADVVLCLSPPPWDSPIRACLFLPSGATVLRGGGHDHGQLVLPGRRGPDGLDHLADELGADLGHGLVLGEGHVGEQGRVAHDAGLGVAVDVGLPLPARRVRVPRADVLGLQPLELLLGAQLVGL